MSATCQTDPVVCIDFAVLFVAEFLKDWTTLAMLAILLVLLLRLRADQQRAREAAYARQMLSYAQQREQDAQTTTWKLDGRT